MHVTGYPLLHGVNPYLLQGKHLQCRYNSALVRLLRLGGRGVRAKFSNIWVHLPFKSGSVLTLAMLFMLHIHILIPSNTNSRKVVLAFLCFQGSLVSCHKYWQKEQGPPPFLCNKDSENKIFSLQKHQLVS